MAGGMPGCAGKKVHLFLGRMYPTPGLDNRQKHVEPLSSAVLVGNPCVPTQASRWIQDCPHRHKRRTEERACLGTLLQLLPAISRDPDSVQIVPSNLRYRGYRLNPENDRRFEPQVYTRMIFGALLGSVCTIHVLFVCQNRT